MMKTKIVSIRMDTEKVEQFARLYPNCLPTFLKNCMENAMLDKEFFYSIFFKNNEVFRMEDLKTNQGD